MYVERATSLMFNRKTSILFPETVVRYLFVRMLVRFPDMNPWEHGRVVRIVTTLSKQQYEEANNCKIVHVFEARYAEDGDNSRIAE